MARKQFLESVARALIREEINEDEMAAWVRKATKRIEEELRISEMLKHKVLALSSNRFMAPIDYLHVKDISLAANPSGEIVAGRSKGSLIYCPPAQINQYAAQSHMAGTVPGYFTTHGKQIEIVPWAVPADEYQIGLWYFAKIPALGLEDTATNWLLEDYEDLFQSAVLIYGHRFYLEDDRALLKEGLVSSEISRLNVKYEDAKYGDGPLVAAPTRKMGGRRS